MSNQLVKKNPAEGYQNVFPKTFIDAIKDKESGVSLQEILQGFNMYFLSYNGSRALTRCKVPTVLRKEGLWITYVLYDHTVVTEWYNSDQIDDNSWSMDSNWRVASNSLVGDISVSSDGYWVINGEKTEAKAQGEQGVTPLLRVGANSKLQASYNAGKAWKDISDYIIPRFRWNQGTGTSAGTIQISMDLGKTWTNLSNEITNNLRISRYIGINESLPTSGVAEGTIYMKGPYYDESDTSNANPIYRMWVYAWKGNTLAWQDNGEFTSISAGVVQERGTNTTKVMSQDAVTRELTKLEDGVNQLGQYIENPEWVRVVADNDGKILYGVKTDGKFYFGDGCPPQVQEYVLEQIDAIGIDALLATKVDKVTGKSLIDANFASSQNVIENPEYLEVTTDIEDKILEGITAEGVKKINLPIDTPGVTIEYVDNPEWIFVKTDKNGSIVFGIDKNGILHANIAENKEVLTKKIAINGLIPNAPEVKALKGNDAPIIADEYDQFDTYINLWDSLLNRANHYGTYVEKCWIDGTPYDNSNKIMSDLPTAGSHNPRNDMNQYPLIMYKFIPSLYTESFEHKPNTKRVLIVSGIHGGSSGGDHWESPMAVYYFAKRLVEEFYLTDSLTHLREFVEFDFVPAANPWGLNNLQRVNGQGIDINRDFADFVTVTGQQIKSLVDNGNYDLFWDSHCLGGTSLTEGDLAGANFFWIASGSIERCIGLQMLDYIGAKYSLQTSIMSVVAKSAAWYSYINHKTTISTEIPANTPLYYGDIIGDVHGEEVMKRGADFIQNAFATTCNLLLKNIV